MLDHSPVDRLELLYQISQTINSSLDLDEVLNAVMDEVIAALHAERGFLVLQRLDGGMVFHAARGIAQTTIEHPQFEVSRGVIQQVIQSGEAVLTSDAQRDNRFKIRQSVVDLKLRSILCAPLKIKNNLIGAVYIDSRLQAGIFSQADLDLLNAIASSSAIAIENARLYKVAVEQGRMERELQVARQVQKSLLPHKLPDTPGWEIAARWIPAREVAGDYYDLFEHDQGSLNVVIADVADKGMGSALFMANCRSLLRAAMSAAIDPLQGIEETNRLICADSDLRLFVTLIYSRVNLATGEITYINAGHNPAIYYQAEQGRMVEFERTGMAIGLFEDSPFETRSFCSQSGDFIVYYTDGVTEAVDNMGNEFGVERLKEEISVQRQSSAEGVAEGIIRSFREFTGSDELSDDVTIIVLKRL